MPHAKAVGPYDTIDIMKAFHVLNVALAVIVLGAAIIDPHTAPRLTALVGSVWLGTLLVVPRLTGLKFFSRWQSFIDIVLANRKYLGLWATAWLSAHAGIAVWLYFGSPGELITAIGERPIIILEIASLGILLLLSLLSNKWSYRHIRGWKHIQAAVWAIPPMAVISSFLAARAFLGQPPLLFIATALFILCIVAGAATLFMRHKQPADWLRLGFLAAGALVTLAVLSL